MTGDGALRFTLARTVDLVAVSSGPRQRGSDTLPAHVRLVDLATAGELAELAAALDPPAPIRAEGRPPSADHHHHEHDPGALDGLIARAEARLVRTGVDRGRTRS